MIQVEIQVYKEKIRRKLLDNIPQLISEMK